MCYHAFSDIQYGSILCKFYNNIYIIYKIYILKIILSFKRSIFNVVHQNWVALYIFRIL